MNKETQKYIISFAPKGNKRKGKKKGKTFFELAKRHIIKLKPGDDPDLSKKVDEIVYGI